MLSAKRKSLLDSSFFIKHIGRASTRIEHGKPSLSSPRMHLCDRLEQLATKREWEETNDWRSERLAIGAEDGYDRTTRHFEDYAIPFYACYCARFGPFISTAFLR
jgi:hypothetical protein